MEPKAVVNLRKGEGRTIKAGGLWIFDNEIESVMGSVEDGDIVIVRDLMDIQWDADSSTGNPKLPFEC